MPGWGIDSLLSGKFFEVYKAEGFIRAWYRGRPTRYRNIMDNCGSRGVVPLVGEDRYGNRYYEDFYGDDSNPSGTSTRWVELSDRAEWFMTGRKIPSEWNGWLHRVYDDPHTAGNAHYYDPIYKRRHMPLASGEPHAPYPLGHLSHPYRGTFQKYTQARVYTAWDPNSSKRPKRYD